MQKTTLLFMVDTGRVLLALKRRGLGVGKYNGAGGKQQLGETIETTAVREMQEELGLKVGQEELMARGVLEFRFPDKTASSWDSDCHLFVAHYRAEVHGEASESEEMSPCWVDENSIPYAQMWPDDVIWLPRVLRGETVHYKFWHNATTSEILRYEVLM